MKQQQTVSKNQSRTVNEATSFATVSHAHKNHPLNLQETIGNRVLRGLLQNGLIQAKLRIGRPDDKYEQEADRVADLVTRIPDTGINRKPT